MAPVLNLETCGYIVGGEKKFIWRTRKDGTRYCIPLTIGGHKCEGKGRYHTKKGVRCQKHVGE